MAANLQSEPAARKRKMSHSDDNESLPSSHIDRKLQDTETELKDAENNKASYNGPQKVHVVMLRVANETSARPVPQSAFFSYDTALSFAMKILLQWCEAHYDDYHWKGPEVLTRHCVARYAAYNSQTGKQLAVADVIRVSIFDAKDAEAVPKENQTADLQAAEVKWAEAEQAAMDQYTDSVDMTNDIAAEAIKTAMDLSNDQDAWKEEHGMRVFSGPAE
ncbi:hypothetical protein D6D15_07166 [Aureobasidium pullulans]|uniref:Uncharacterized protein n=1 Tax=Aureobasidium pullulans TaxID=5580 RepID=A0A4S9B455_AURPU|nr:hypothetical protein D6D15_07166 [Aureobasidium pullulans]